MKASNSPEIVSTAGCLHSMCTCSINRSAKDIACTGQQALDWISERGNSFQRYQKEPQKEWSSAARTL